MTQDRKQVTLWVSKEVKSTLRAMADEYNTSMSKLGAEFLTTGMAESKQIREKYRKVAEYQRHLDKTAWDRLEGNWTRTLYNLASMHWQDGTPPEKMETSLKANRQMAEEFWGEVESTFYECVIKWYSNHYSMNATTEFPSQKWFWKKAEELCESPKEKDLEALEWD